MRKAGVFAAITTFVGVLALGIGSAGLAAASGNGTPGVGASDPGGNNGTIKLDTTELVPVGKVDHANHPHVTCVFSLSFFGFDSGLQTAVVNFTGQPPSGKFVPVAPVVGPGSFQFYGDGAGNHLDASKAYSLDVTGLFYNPNEGYHIKVVADVSGSKGADEKYKVFWYKPCGSGSGGQVTTTTTTSTVLPTTTSTTSTTSTTTTTLLPSTGTGGLAGGSTTTTSTPPLVTNGSAPLVSGGAPAVSGQAPQVASGQAPELGAGSTPQGAATDLGFFQPNWFGSSDSPWILMIVAGVLLAGTGAGIGYRMRRA